MTELAAQEGLEYHLDRTRGGNSFDAHRLIHLAAAHGLQDAVKERLMRAYFTEGEAIGDPDALARLAAEVGLDPRGRAVLDGDAYADAVRADEELARRIGIQGVPFFVLDRSYGVSGAQPAELLSSARRRWRQADAPERPRPVAGARGLDRARGAAQHARPRAARRPARLPPLLARRAPRAVARRARAGGADRTGRRGHRADPRRQRRRDAAALLAVQGGRERSACSPACIPGRIDLGLGRASGTDPLTTYALQRDRREVSPDDFPQQLAELLAHFDGTFPADHPFARLGQSLPGGAASSPRSGCSAPPRRARSGPPQLGLPYAFADFINPSGADIARSYRERAESPHARRGRRVGDRRRHRRGGRAAGVLDRHVLRDAAPGPADPRAAAREGAALPRAARRPAPGRRRIVGSPETVRAGIEEVASEYGADEVIVVTITLRPRGAPPLVRADLGGVRARRVLCVDDLAIGYERLLPAELVAELQAARIQRLIDVRFRPQSRRPGMSKTRLGETLGDHGIAYEHRKPLGTPPDIRRLFRPAASARAPRHSAPTSSGTPPTRSTRWPPSSSAGRAPRCCAWRPTRPCHRRVVAEVLAERLPGAQSRRPLGSIGWRRSASTTGSRSRC